MASATNPTQVSTTSASSSSSRPEQPPPPSQVERAVQPLLQPNQQDEQPPSRVVNLTPEQAEALRQAQPPQPVQQPNIPIISIQNGAQPVPAIESPRSAIPRILNAEQAILNQMAQRVTFIGNLLETDTVTAAEREELTQELIILRDFLLSLQSR